MACPRGSDTPSRDYASGDRGCKYGGARIGPSCHAREHWWGNGWRLCSTEHLCHRSILPPQCLHHAEAVPGQPGWTRSLKQRLWRIQLCYVVQPALHARLRVLLQLAFHPVIHSLHTFCRSCALQQTFFGSPPACPVLGFSPPYE